MEQKQTAVEWLDRWFRDNPEATHEEGNKALHHAKQMEKQQKNNLPIHIHEGIKNTWVYIEDGIVHVKPNP